MNHLVIQNLLITLEDPEFTLLASQLNFYPSNLSNAQIIKFSDISEIDPPHYICERLVRDDKKSVVYELIRNGVDPNLFLEASIKHYNANLFHFLVGLDNVQIQESMMLEILKTKKYDFLMNIIVHKKCNTIDIIMASKLGDISAINMLLRHADLESRPEFWENIKTEDIKKLDIF